MKTSLLAMLVALIIPPPDGEPVPFVQPDYYLITPQGFYQTPSTTPQTTTTPDYTSYLIVGAAAVVGAILGFLLGRSR